MSGAILSLTTIGALIALAISAAAGKRILQGLPWVGLFLAVYFLDNLIHLFVNTHPALQLIPNGFYQGAEILLWSAKIYSILACLGIAYLLRAELPPALTGLTLRQKPGAIIPGLIAMLIAGGVAAVLGLGFDRGPFNLVLLLYMAVMPGLNEELVYRGLLLGLLDKLLPPARQVLGAPIGWGSVITALLFGLLHGFWVEADWSVHINGLPVLFSCLTGMLFAWLQARSGSLVFPVLTHGLIDFSIFLTRMTG